MSAPSDLELMQFFDGELDAARRAEVDAWLQRANTKDDANDKGGNAKGANDKGGNAKDGAGDEASEVANAKAAAEKLAGLELLGGLLRAASPAVLSAELARVPTGFDVVQSVMDRLAAESASEVESKTESEAEPPRGAKVIPIESRKRQSLEPEKAPESHLGQESGGRLILGMALVAAAAAAALFFWGRTPAPNVDLAANTGTGTPTSLAPVLPLSAAPLASVDMPGVDPLTEPVGVDPEPTVEVAAVDFGSRLGAIYYVDADRQGSSTTVVWVTDD